MNLVEIGLVQLPVPRSDFDVVESRPSHGDAELDLGLGCMGVPEGLEIAAG